MKDNQKIDFGSVQVHKKVLAEIIHTAIMEVEGLRLVSKTLKEYIFSLFGQECFSGIDLKVDDNGSVQLAVRVFVRYGVNIPDVARQAQDAIKAVIDKTIDIDLKDININVQGIDKEGV
ncbi:hypothetical protein MNBD_UNCLBAC01-1491 [hydrothermal vent metagenome]|uniref:Asp23/Gls24 family envelope stress response protein n=1 Tax=hydrothermal vent metagenome TaxID=652676 RepID=A0A3B1D4I7_9ZZZZ